MEPAVKTVLQIQVQWLIQYLSFTKALLDAFVPPQPTKVVAPAVAPNAVALRRGGCVGPADLRE